MLLACRVCGVQRLIMKLKLIPFAAISAVASGVNAAEVGYYSQPALHGDRLVFVSEGDLWTATVPPDGTSASAATSAAIIAHRLTSSDGVEGRPVFSVDGRFIAFSAQYDGNTDVYTMPI